MDVEFTIRCPVGFWNRKWSCRNNTNSTSIQFSYSINYEYDDSRMCEILYLRRWADYNPLLTYFLVGSTCRSGHLPDQREPPWWLSPPPCAQLGRSKTGSTNPGYSGPSSHGKTSHTSNPVYRSSAVNKTVDNQLKCVYQTWYVRIRFVQ